MTTLQADPFRLTIADSEFDLTTRALVMGILNRTPDSFYDKGRFFGFDESLARAEEIVSEGADIIDIGGVKAGPGPFVSPAEEIDRVCPAIEAVSARFDLPISVDTFTAEVAVAAIEAGAVIVNDISGLGDPDMGGVVADSGATVVVTHIQGRPRVANPDPRYADLMGEVLDFLRIRAKTAEAQGVSPDRIIVDAGLDLGKSPQQSLVLLRETEALLNLGYPVLLSSSNKRFIGEALDLELGARAGATAATVAWAMIGGARIVRVHEVELMADVCRMIQAVLES